jgi:hypothetical protein
MIEVEERKLPNDPVLDTPTRVILEIGRRLTELAAQQESDGDVEAAQLTLAKRDRVLSAASLRPKLPRTQSVVERLGGRTLGQISDRPGALDGPLALLPRMGWKGRVTLLSAQEKVGKSTLLSAGAAALSVGGYFLGEQCDVGTVLWIAAEEHEYDLAKRLVDQGAHRDRVLIFGPLQNPLVDLDGILAEVRPDLVVPDTLPTLVKDIVEGSSDTVWSKIMSAFTEMAHTYNCAVILPTHAKKNTPGYRDSNRIGAGVDMILEMSEHPTDPNVRTIKPKGRWKLTPYSVRLAENGLYELASGEQSRESRVLAVIAANPGISQRRVLDQVTGKEADTKVIIANLIVTKRIRDEGVGGKSGMKLYAVGLTSGHTSELVRPEVDAPGHGVASLRPHLDGEGEAETDSLRRDDLASPESNDPELAALLRDMEE